MPIQPAIFHSPGPPRVPGVPQTRGLIVKASIAADRDQLDEFVGAAEDAGLNLLVVEGLRAGICFHQPPRNSATMIRTHADAGRRDLLGEALDRVSRSRLAAYVSVDLLGSGDGASRLPGAVGRERRRMVMRNAEGQILAVAPDREWFCPVNPLTRRHLSEILCQIAMRYPLDGFVALNASPPLMSKDPASTLCYCDSCRRSVDKDLLFSLQNMSLEVDDPGFRRWVRWRVEQVEGMITSLRAHLHGVQTGLRFLAALPDGEQVAGPWTRWMEEGLLHGMVAQDSKGLDLSDPMIGAACILRCGSLQSPADDLAALARTLAARSEPGFLVDTTLLAPALPAVVDEVFAETVIPFEADPRASARQFIACASSVLGSHTRVCAMLDEVVLKSLAIDDMTGEAMEAAAAAAEYCAAQLEDDVDDAETLARARPLLETASRLLRAAALG